MQITVNLKGIEEVKAQLDRLKPKQQASAIAAAINKTAAKGKTEATRAITERYNIKASEVSNSVSIRAASAAQGKLEATIDIFGSTKKRGRSLNMIHFVERKVSQAKKRKRLKDGTSKQLRFNIIKGGGQKQILGDAALKNGAFIGNNGRTVFQRTGNARLPIKPVQVIGVSQMFNFKRIHDRVIDKIKAEFITELNRAIKGKIEGYL